ncbi:MAG TPA: Clp protease N-terminal domain-containing protein, partial [Prolixibacteraceae bacterium]|nr:Clp protease N-terminal domain-containing protein [Prolixibacteraceae bacterium]
MKYDNFTIKSQEALQKAMQIAQGNNQQALETGHMLKGLFMEAENVVQFLLKKTGVNTQALQLALDKIIESYPRVVGGEQYVSNGAGRAAQKASALAFEMGDQFVSVEHLLLALVENGDSVSQLLKDAGANTGELKKAIAELRKGSKADSPTAEDRFDSLNRYAINLNERARIGKLDPVIGRDDEIRRILQILSRRTKNNPILIGEPGTGKTAIV